MENRKHCWTQLQAKFRIKTNGTDKSSEAERVKDSLWDAARRKTQAHMLKWTAQSLQLEQFQFNPVIQILQTQRTVVL